MNTEKLIRVYDILDALKEKQNYLKIVLDTFEENGVSAIETKAELKAYDEVYGILDWLSEEGVDEGELENLTKEYVRQHNGFELHEQLRKALMRLYDESICEQYDAYEGCSDRGLSYEIADAYNMLDMIAYAYGLREEVYNIRLRNMRISVNSLQNEKGKKRK